MNIIPQRGFIQLSLLGWCALAAGVLILGLSVALKFSMASNGALRDKVATVEANRDQWKQSAETCSKETEDAAKEAEKRTRNAANALKQARTGEQQAKDEIARLSSSVASGSVCLGDQAVAIVRQGLVVP